MGSTLYIGPSAQVLAERALDRLGAGRRPIVLTRLVNLILSGPLAERLNIARSWRCVRNLRGGERSGRLKIVWRHVAKIRPGPRNDDRRNKRNLVLPVL
jgi:hypothetical protein